jgi:hypothetical protein
MKTLLPIVNDDIGFSLAHRFKDSTPKEFWDAELNSLKAENPVVANFILSLAKLSEDPTRILTCGVMTYSLLRSQAEADLMTKEIKI